MRVGWFSPISVQTGISAYSQNILNQMHRLFPDDEVDVIVFHPPTDDEIQEMPYPTIALSDSLLASDFHALFDIAVYHLGNNSKNHDPIYDALMQHPGIVVLHDYVYHHFLAGKSVEENFIGPSYGNLVYERGGAEAFTFLRHSQVMRCDLGRVAYVPWESDWSVTVPFCDVLARLGVGAIVHSDYARRGVGDTYPSPIASLFMPPPEVPEELDQPISLSDGGPVHIVFCGHIGSTKGLTLLTSAFTQFPQLRKLFRVTVAGFGSDPNFLNEFQSILTEQKLKNVFTLRIGLAEKEFQETLASADVFFNLRFPNTEGASLSLAEQLAFGRPVIAYRTGCFSEIPEDAAYFLDHIGDAEELGELLLRMASERADIPARGAAARAAVKGQTPETYARDIVAFLKDNMDTFKRRISLLERGGAETAVPQAGPEDVDWLDAYTQSYHPIRGTFEKSILPPDGFFAAPDFDKGQILATNLLHSRASERDYLQLGELLSDLDVVEMHHLVGRLILLSQSPQDRQALVPEYLDGTFLPDFDIKLWRALMLLDIRKAIPMALLALNIKDKEVDPLIENARKNGANQVMLKVLRETSYDRKHPHVAQLIDMLEQNALAYGLANLPSIPHGEDLLELLREGQDTSILTSGFHKVEKIGIWSKKKSATMHFRPKDDKTIKKISGTISLLVPVADALPEVTLSATEIASGKSVSVTVSRPPEGSADNLKWSLDTSFSGPISLTLEVDNLIKPSTLQLSDDTRKLGALLNTLVVK